MLTDIDVRRAIEFESREYSVLSVYLNLDFQQRTSDQYKLALRNLLSQADGAATEDLRKMQSYVEMGYNWQGQGLVMFSCAAEDFWWAQSLLTPVQDQVFVSFRPYVHQLASLLDSYDRLGVIQVDQMGARLYAFRMGYLEAVHGYLGEEVKAHKAGGWAAPRYQRHEEETARQNLQDAAELAEEFYRRNQTRRLILAGTETNVARFREMLSNRLRSMVVGQIAADANSSPNELQKPALEIAQNTAAQDAARVADGAITAAYKGSNGVIGLADTLNAVQNGRAQHVVVLAGYSEPAYRFVHTGYVVLTPENELGLDDELQELPDAVDSVLRRSLMQGIDVSVLDAHPALEKAGKIAAITRY